MRLLSQKAGGNSPLKPVLLFVMHQFLGTWGIAMSAYFFGGLWFDLLIQFGWLGSMRHLHWILTETPFFPLQIALGLYSGWYLNRRLNHRSMVWVWILPGLILCYAVVAIPTLFPRLTSVLAVSSNPLSHYFGWGCRPKDGCLDQLLVTMPFYAATAYSSGAWIAQQMANRRS